jgi:ABC-2 type transport system ATP-binding protein
VCKALLHRPELVLLDEPSTGLDPAARREVWTLLRGMALTVLLTTHLLDEGDDADHVLILDRGKVAAEGEPAALKRALGGEVLEVACAEGERAAVAAYLRQAHGLEAAAAGAVLRARADDAHRLVPALVEALGPRLERVAVSRPTLEDVFMARTGSAFDRGEGA